MKALLSKSALVGVISMIAASAANAALIAGEIHVSQFGSTAAVDFVTNTVTFTPVAPAQNAQVVFTTGDFNGLLGAPVSYQGFTYSPLSVNGGGAIWTGGGVSFTLTSITSILEGAPNSLDLSGKGFLTMAGYDPTPGAWSFSADKSGASFAFSSTATAQVPDGGGTLVLCGASLLGLYGVRRKFAKN